MSEDKKDLKTPTGTPTGTDRRKLLKSLAAGSAMVTGGKTLSETWAKPITDIVILPSHAVTTSGDLTVGDAVGGNTGDGYQQGGPNSEYAGSYQDEDGVEDDDENDSGDNYTAEYLSEYFGDYYSSENGDTDGEDGDYTYGDYNSDGENTDADVNPNA